MQKFRRELHKNPELSGSEKQTSIRIRNYILQFNPDEVIENIGGYGIAFVFNGNRPGPALMFRSELDALPIEEINDFSYRSVQQGISHKCGHDGHMAILSGLAQIFHKKPPDIGRVILLFQPSEETGRGAAGIISDPKFISIMPDLIFALHNLPGFNFGNIILKEDVFSSASIGLIIRLKGKTSHAAEPEKGLNPSYAMASVINSFKKYRVAGDDPENVKIITPIYARIGEKAFGTSPGYAEMMFTLRATYRDDFEKLKKYAIEVVSEFAEHEKLVSDYEWIEEFPNTVNDHECVKTLVEAAKQLNYKTEIIKNPFRWSEDFGHFLQNYKGAIFGIGSGITHPALHNPDYDFPDELIDKGIQMFYSISKIILK